MYSPDSQPYSAGFVRWWSTYPRKVGKRASYKKYQQALLAIKEELQQKAFSAVSETQKTPSQEKNINFSELAEQHLLEITRLFASSDVAQGPFCPHPLTWLNQGRWEDDPAEWQDRHRAQTRVEASVAGAENYLRLRSQQASNQQASNQQPRLENHIPSTAGNQEAGEYGERGSDR